jgi:hypothetical protein
MGLGEQFISQNKKSACLCYNTLFRASHLDPYVLTPRSRVLLEKLTGIQLVKKFATFYGTPRFITLITGARQLFLS